MGVIETAIVALALFSTLTIASSITSAIMGSKRKIGSARGFLLGMLLPIVGVGLVALSKKNQPKVSTEPIATRKSRANSQSENTYEQSLKSRNKQYQHSESLKQVGKSVAREQFQKEHTPAVKKKKQSWQSQSLQQVQTQSHGKGMSR